MPPRSPWLPHSIRIHVTCSSAPTAPFVGQNVASTGSRLSLPFTPTQRELFKLRQAETADSDSKTADSESTIWKALRDQPASPSYHRWGN